MFLYRGSYGVTITAHNAYGSDQGVVNLRFASLGNFSHTASFDFSAYDGNETLIDFPIFLEFDSSISKFSLKSFASPQLNDSRLIILEGN